MGQLVNPTRSVNPVKAIRLRQSKYKFNHGPKNLKLRHIIISGLLNPSRLWPKLRADFNLQSQQGYLTIPLEIKRAQQ